MAQQLPDDIQLKLDRPSVTVEEFAHAIEALFAVVRAVGDEVMGGRADGVRWVIHKLEVGSAVLAARAEIVDEYITPELVNQTIKAVGHGLKMLETTSERPDFFGDKALRAARNLAEILNSNDVGTNVARFGTVSLHPSKRVVGNVDDLIAGKLKSIGSIEGRMVTLSASDGFVFYVIDRITKRKVKCHIEDELLPQVLSAFNQRVIVRGVIWSRKDGTPERIEVRHFEAVEPNDKLPKSRDVRGILRALRVNGE